MALIILALVYLKKIIPLIEKKAVFNSYLQTIFPIEQCKNSLLKQAASYALFSSGKRIRPLLVLHLCEYLQFPWEKALDAACSIEFVHTYSLIHDDLPCMDDDDFRRGLPTVHKKFGEAVALLAGNFLLSKAFSFIADSKQIERDKKIELTSILAKTAGNEGLLGGQLLDMILESNSFDSKILTYIHYRKTAHLFSTCFLFAAILSNVPKKKKILLRKLGIAYGLCYQLADDINDFEQDQRQNKITLATQNLEQANQKYKQIHALMERYFHTSFLPQNMQNWLKDSLKIEKKGIVTS